MGFALCALVLLLIGLDSTIVLTRYSHTFSRWSRNLHALRHSLGLPSSLSSP